ncbi:MAG: ATP-binding protein [Peptococcaceae bacterium]|nr:ATP-binding protein [Peptococcaceae bacterium]
MYIERHLASVIKHANTTFPVVMLTGPRQVGKTTLLENLAEPDRAYVSLDSPLNREMAKSEPELFLQRHPPPVLIDEFQYAKELLPFIKIYVDKHKNPGDFWLTGSQMFHMMKNVSESLAGRVAVIPMQGLSRSEMIGLPRAVFPCDPQDWLERLQTYPPMDLLSFYESIFKGSLPKPHTSDVNRELFYSSYVDTYLRRDVHDLTQVADESAFLRFLTACAARTGQQVTYEALARDAGISSPTAKQWVSILVTSGIVILVEPYYSSALKRMVKSPKLYFTDTGICTYLTRFESAKTLEVSAMSSAIFETWVIGEVVKSYYNAGRRPPIFYYRDTDQQEIDLIIEANTILYPFEIKKTASPGKNDIRHFRALEKTKREIGPGGVICMTDSVYPINERNCSIPAWLI